ncbi:hypothetical protein Tco_1351411 [Tanacetum coccineum]
MKAITLPQDVLSTSDSHLIELENQVQRLMEAHLALTQPTQVNKITTPCEICSGPHDTQNYMENPERAFVEYASSRTDEAREGLVSEFMASQDARLYKFEANFKRQQGEMTNKIDIVLKAITDQITGTLPSDAVKNLKLGTYPVSRARSYPIMYPQCSTQIHNSINAITIHPKQPDESKVNKPEVEQEEDNPGDTNSNPHPQPDPLASISIEQVWKLNSMLESLELVPQSSNMKFVCSKEDDGEVMFIEIIRDDDEPQNEDPNEGEGATTKETIVEYFDTFPTRNELTYYRTDEVVNKMPHKIEQYDSLSDLEKEHTKSVYLRNEGDKRRGVQYVMSKILGFYKECLELGPKYLTRMDDEGEVT